MRIQIGGLILGDLHVGQHRVLTQDEVKRYFPEKSAGKSARAKRPAKPRPPAKKGVLHG